MRADHGESRHRDDEHLVQGRAGKALVKRGVDFLYFQSGSQGYASVVKGPKDQVGSFDLEQIDEAQGQAIIHSTDPFNKDLERGVIIGGLSAPGDLDFIDVDNSR